jgi:hypothetical protein
VNLVTNAYGNSSQSHSGESQEVNAISDEIRLVLIDKHQIAPSYGIKVPGRFDHQERVMCRSLEAQFIFQHVPTEWDLIDDCRDQQRGAQFVLVRHQDIGQSRSWEQTRWPNLSLAGQQPVEINIADSGQREQSLHSWFGAGLVALQGTRGYAAHFCQRIA